MLKGLTNFDWISPLWAIIRNVASGGCHTFLIPADCGWTVREITRLLKRKHIASWGLMIINNTFVLSVYKKQAARAQEILSEAGVPVETPVTKRRRW